MSELRILRCRSCGAAWFPDRLRCPRCGGRAWARIVAGCGTVEEETTVRRVAVRLGSVRLDAGPVVIARLRDGAVPGARVGLESDGQGAIWARSAQGASGPID